MGILMGTMQAIYDSSTTVETKVRAREALQQAEYIIALDEPVEENFPMLGGLA